MDPGTRLTRLQSIITGDNSKATKLSGITAAISHSRMQISLKPGEMKSLALCIFLRLPLDVINEIACCLYPLDLLRLSRASKDFHRLFMSENSRLIWRTVIRAVGIPDCPSDITEPQFISLMFESFCQGCDAPNVKRVDYGLRIRLCQGCLALNTVKGQKLLNEVRNTTPTLNQEALTLCYFEGASSMTQHSREQMPHDKFARRIFFRPDFMDVVGQYCAFVPGSSEQTEFIRRRKELVNNVCEIKHAAAIDRWLKQFGSRRAPETSLKYRSRELSFLKRLKTLGYSEADLDDASRQDRFRRFVLQPRELTERIWRSILPSLEEVIKQRRMLKLESARTPYWPVIESLYEDFCSRWETLNGRPPLLNMDSLKRVPEIITLADDAVSELRVTRDRWEEVKLVLPNIILKFESGIKSACARRLNIARYFAGFPDLSAAKANMVDAVLEHASSFIVPKGDEYTKIRTYTDIIFDRSSHALLPPKTQCVDVMEIACALIRQFELDDDIPMADMEKFGKAFVCRRCDRRPPKKRTWRELVEHFLLEIKRFNVMQGLLQLHPDHGLTIINSHKLWPSGTTLAEMCPEVEGEGDEEDIGGPRYSCSLCKNVTGMDYYRASFACIEAHLRSGHRKTDIEPSDMVVVDNPQNA